MDIVIPLSKGSKWNDNELRFMLRSFCKFYPNHDQVIVIGAKPSWLKGIYHIKAEDTPGMQNKERNIMNKILIACATTVSQKFVFANDDHFLTKPVSSFPYLYGFDLKESIKARRNHDHYWSSLTNTVKVLGNKDTKNFDIHYPIVYDKTEFPKVMKSYDWSIPFGYVIKSLYCNTLGIKGRHEQDLKINSRMDCFQLEATISDKSFFSVGDKCISADLLTFLNYLYPDKSKYE